MENVCIFICNGDARNLNKGYLRQRRRCLGARALLAPVPDRDTPSSVNSTVSLETLLARAINYGSAPNHQIVHA